MSPPFGPKPSWSEPRRPLRTRLGLRGCTFVYVRRLWRGKASTHLLQAFRIASGALPHELSLLIVGDGPDESGLRDRAVTMGLRNIVFAGFHSSAMLSSLYAASDVFVFPSLGDPYGLVLDEAMACSLPIISARPSGNWAFDIAIGQNGLTRSAGGTQGARRGHERARA